MGRIEVKLWLLEIGPGTQRQTFRMRMSCIFSAYICFLVEDVEPKEQHKEQHTGGFLVASLYANCASCSLFLQ